VEFALIILAVLIGVIVRKFRNKQADFIPPACIPDLVEGDADCEALRTHTEPQTSALGCGEILKSPPIDENLSRVSAAGVEAGATPAPKNADKPSKRYSRPTLHLPVVDDQKIIPRFRRAKGERVVIVDLETTGLSPTHGARIIEISAREIVDGKLGESFETLVNPGGLIPSEITEITGISSDMVRTAPEVEKVTKEFLKFLAASPLIGHNIAFDLRFCRFEMGLADSTPNLCTLLLARRLYPGHSSYKLEAICRVLGISTPVRLHRAAADTLATAELFRRIRTDADVRWGGDGIDVGSLATLQRLEARRVDNWFAANKHA
jgi:DNA polymerase III subunit epsilon